MQKVYLNPLFLIVTSIAAIFAFAPFRFNLLIGVVICTLFYVINNTQIKSKWWHILGLGYVFGLGFFNTQLYWIYYSLHYVINTSIFVAIVAQIGFTFYLATYTALAFFIAVKLKTKNHLFNLMLLYPSIWVLFDWLRGWVLTGFSWCDFGYSVVNMSLFRGIFPILGEYAVTWILMSILGALYFIISQLLRSSDSANLGSMSQQAHSLQSFQRVAKPPKSHVRFAQIYLLVLFLALIAIAPLQYTHKYGKPVKIALLQGNVPVNTKWSDEHNLNTYANMIKDAKADIVIIPETAITRFEDDLPSGYLAKIVGFAKKNGAELIVGMPKIIDDNDNYVNAAVLLTQKDHPFYAKYHLVPYGEYIPVKKLLGPMYKYVSLPMVNFSRGAIDQPPLLVANEKLAFNICYENGFGSELLPSTRNSTIMANLSDMAWYGNTIAMDQHLVLSQARALENQRYFIQDTNTSITAVINPQGQIEARLPIFKQDVLVDYIQGMIGHTPYEIYGNYPIIILCLILIFIAGVKKYAPQKSLDKN